MEAARVTASVILAKEIGFLSGGGIVGSIYDLAVPILLIGKGA